MTNKIEVDKDNDGVRNAADRQARRTRRTRKAFNGTTRHLEIDPEVQAALSKEGHLAWINDDLRGCLIQYEDMGYRFVLNREVYGEDREDKKPNDRVHVRYGTADERGTPQDIYLMLQPWEFFDEDQAIAASAAAAVDKQIHTSHDVERNYEKRVDYQTK